MKKNKKSDCQTKKNDAANKVEATPTTVIFNFSTVPTFRFLFLILYLLSFYPTQVKFHIVVKGVETVKVDGDSGKVTITNKKKPDDKSEKKISDQKSKEIIFLETICNDINVIERNILLKIQQSPDYAEEPDFEAGLQDFQNRLANYERVYEPVEKGSYIKMIDMVSGHGGQIQLMDYNAHHSQEIPKARRRRASIKEASMQSHLSLRSS